MSNSAKGFINSVPGAPGRFAASQAFAINKVLFNAYDNIGDLTSTKAFSGPVGVADITLVFDNGPTITGKLDMPIDPYPPVCGSVVWTQN